LKRNLYHQISAEKYLTLFFLSSNLKKKPPTKSDAKTIPKHLCKQFYQTKSAVKSVPKTRRREIYTSKISEEKTLSKNT